MLMVSVSLGAGLLFVIFTRFLLRAGTVTHVYAATLNHPQPRALRAQPTRRVRLHLALPGSAQVP